MLGAYGTPILGGRGGRRGSPMVPLERAMVVSYRLCIVTVALSVTIRPQFAIECLRRSNQQGVGEFWPKFRGVPLGADPSCWGCKERTSQANWWWNYFERIPTYVITIHQCHGRTERRTDRRHAIAIPRFALKCIARVKTVHFWLEYNGLAIVGKTTQV